MTEFTSNYPPPSGQDPSKTEAAKSAAADVAGGAKDAAATVAHTAADQAKDVATETKAQARDLLGEGRTQLQEQARKTQSTAASSLGALADELRQMSDGSQQSGTASELVRQASDRAQGLASWLRDREPGDALQEIRSFARNRPGAFILGAALAGVAAGRLTRGAVAAAHDDSPASPATPSPAAAVPANGLVVPYEPAPLTGYVDAPVPASDLAGPSLTGSDLRGDEWAAPGRVPTAGTAL